MPNGSFAPARDEMLGRENAGDHAERAVIFAGIDHGVDVRADQQALAAARRAARAPCRARPRTPQARPRASSAATQIGGAACSGVRNSRTSRSGSAEIAPSVLTIASARAPSASMSMGRRYVSLLLRRDPLPELLRARRRSWRSGCRAASPCSAPSGSGSAAHACAGRRPISSVTLFGASLKLSCVGLLRVAHRAVLRA